jgi:signal peptidase I
VKGFTRGVLWVAGILGAICLLLHLFVFEVWTVPRGPDDLFGASILPTLKVDDRVLVQRGRRPNIGELARCSSPLVSGGYVVGRVFGKSRDRVEVTDRRVTTNGQALASRYACPPVVVPHPVTQSLVTMHCEAHETGAWTFETLSPPEGMSAGTSQAVVEPGKVYLLSDNRLMHHDSRDFGQVDESTCEHIVFRLWGEKFSDGSRRFNVLW